MATFVFVCIESFSRNICCLQSNRCMKRQLLQFLNSEIGRRQCFTFFSKGTPSGFQKLHLSPSQFMLSVMGGKFILTGAFVWYSVACLYRSPITVTSLDNTHNSKGLWHSGYLITLGFFWTYCWIRSAKTIIDSIVSANQSIVPSIQTTSAIYLLSVF